MIKFNFPLILTALIIFLLSSCGGGSRSISAPPSGEYEIWKSTLPATVEGFVQRWGEIGKGWKFYWFDNTGTPSLSYKEYKNLTPAQIFSMKAINCHFATILLKDIYGGEYLFLPHPIMSHTILLYQRNAKYYYVSYSGKFEIRELVESREESLDLIRDEFKTEIQFTYPKTKF